MELKNLKNDSEKLLTKKESIVELVDEYGDAKLKTDNYKKISDKLNKDLKKSMDTNDFSELSGNDYTATLGTQERKSFDDDKLLDKIKSMNLEEKGIIKTREYIDMDILENLIYNNDIDASELASCENTKIIKTLRIKKN